MGFNWGQDFQPTGRFKFGIQQKLKEHGGIYKDKEDGFFSKARTHVSPMGNQPNVQKGISGSLKFNKGLGVNGDIQVSRGSVFIGPLSTVVEKTIKEA